MSFFSTAFSAIIDRRNWKQRHVVEATGIKQTSVSEYMNGLSAPTPENFRRILSAVDDEEKRDLIRSSYRDLVPQQYGDLLTLSSTGEGSVLREEAAKSWADAPLGPKTSAAIELLAAHAAIDKDLQATLQSLADFIRATQKPTRRKK